MRGGGSAIDAVPGLAGRIIVGAAGGFTETTDGEASDIFETDFIDELGFESGNDVETERTATETVEVFDTSED